MGSPRDLISLVQAKDPAASSQERAMILDVVKKTYNGRVKFSDAVAM